MTLTDSAVPERVGTGRWAVDASRSRVELEMQVCGLVAVRGRFAGVRGLVESDDGRAGEGGFAVHVEVDAATLTAGSWRRDALLGTAGIIDPEAGPVITYRASTVLPEPDGRWRVLGVIGTARCALPLRLIAEEPAFTPDGTVLRACGEITREDVVRLLTRPGAAALLGPTARLDLTLALSPAWQQ